MASIPQIPAEVSRIQDRRFHLRRRFEQLVYGDLGPENGGILLDLSEGGLRFQGVGTVSEGQFIRLKFSLPGAGANIEATAQHVWWSNDLLKPGGLRFVDLAEEARQQIRTWISGQAHEDPSARIGKNQTEPRADSTAIEKTRMVVAAPDGPGLEAKPTRSSVPPEEMTAQAGPSAEPLPELAEFAPSPVVEGRAADTGATPVQEAAIVVETATVLVGDDSAADTSAPRIQEVTEVVPIAPSPVADDSAAETSVPAVQAETENVEVAPHLVIDESTADSSACPVQGAAEKEVPQSSPVVCRNEKPLPPSFLSFYGLGGQPFDVTPDPEYLYLSQTHREALTSLSQGIQNFRGFMALIGEPGIGKTTLLNKLMEDLRDSARTVFLFQTQCNSRELLRYLLTELGVENAGMDVVTMHKALYEILFQDMLKGRRFVLIVDEAQNLHDSVLETIRLLSDFETTTTKLLQIVLSGQPQLVETLMRPSLSQLRQRIAVLANLEPLGATETVQFVEHRLRLAGWIGKPIFTPHALALIAERSQGIPRNINNLCFNALLSGHSEGRRTIDYAIVQKVAAKLDLASLVRHSQEDTVRTQAAPESFNENRGKSSMTLIGKLAEKVISRSWTKEIEYRIVILLERECAFDIAIADRYYCCRLYVSEEQAAALRAGRPIRIKFEQD